MGVESNFYVLPENSGFRPTAQKFCELIEKFRAKSYLCDPQSASFESSPHRCPPALKGLARYEGFDWRMGSERGVGDLGELEQRIAQNDGADFRVRWPNTDLIRSGLKYPLSQVPVSDGVYYDIELHLSTDTVYHSSEVIDPFDEPIHCPCGATLASFEPPHHDIFCSLRLPNCCRVCGKPANYSGVPFVIRDAWTGEESRGYGGITYRFSVMIDCGKMIPEKGTTVLTEFRQIVEQCLQCRTRSVQDFY